MPHKLWSSLILNFNWIRPDCLTNKCKTRTFVSATRKTKAEKPRQKGDQLLTGAVSIQVNKNLVVWSLSGTGNDLGEVRLRRKHDAMVEIVGHGILQKNRFRV